MDKLKVKQHFSSIANVYDKFAIPQKKWGSKLINTAPSGNGIKTILDIGMGTGWMALGLSKMFKSAKIFGCDISSTMIECAKGKTDKSTGKKFSFLESDFEAMPYKGNYFDLVFSNMSLQWASDLKTALKETFRVLKNNGSFYFTIPGKKTLKESKKLFEDNGLNWKPGHNFTDETAITSLLKETGFKNTQVDISEEAIDFKDFLSFINWLKMTGSNTGVDTGLNGLNAGRRLIELNKKNNSRFIVTFEILFVQTKK